MYIDRQMQPLLTELQTQFPALLVTGPRQVGKSTLLKHMAPDHHYVSFDDPLLRQQADDDPALFLRNHPDRLILDDAVDLSGGEGLRGGEVHLPLCSSGRRCGSRGDERAESEREGGEDRPHAGDSTGRMHECSVLKT